MQENITRLNLGNAAPNGELLDINDNSFKLYSLLNGKPTLLSFLRHFG
jgi:hypothetical protein